MIYASCIVSHIDVKSLLNKGVQMNAKDVLFCTQTGLWRRGEKRTAVGETIVILGLGEAEWLFSWTFLFACGQMASSRENPSNSGSLLNAKICVLVSERERPRDPKYPRVERGRKKKRKPRSSYHLSWKHSCLSTGPSMFPSSTPRM